MNTELLEKVKAHILEEPRRFMMEDFCDRLPVGTKVTLDDVERPVASCGTAACIGGWAVILGAGTPRNWEKFDFYRTACELLGLTLDECDESEDGDRLFFTIHWPQLYRQGYSAASTVEGKAKIAAERIDHFISTNGAE